MSISGPLLDSIYRAVKEFADISADSLSVMPTAGLAHDHVIIDGTDWLLRIPRQSQMQLAARDNLLYQATCFERMSAGGHTPRCHRIIEPSTEIPMGALVVDHIRGRALQSPAEMHLVAEALASFHSLPLPSENLRAPLLSQKNPLADTLQEVLTQAHYLSIADVPHAALVRIRHELKLARHDVDSLPVAPVALVSFDTHPGNFVVDNQQRVYLVDLEKGRYGGAGFDLAHASLYTSTTWDPSSYSELSAPQLQQFYRDWMQAMPDGLADKWLPFLMPMRRLMWLWAVTWCAKWQVESRKNRMFNKHVAKNTEDWSAENTEEQLVAHVRERVNHYLSPQVVERVCDDWT